MRRIISEELLHKILIEAINNNSDSSDDSSGEKPTPMYEFRDGNNPEIGQLVSGVGSLIANIEYNGQNLEIRKRSYGANVNELILAEPTDKYGVYRFYGEGIENLPEEVLQNAQIEDYCAKYKYFLELFHQYNENSVIDNGDVPNGWINVGTVPYSQYGEGDINVWVNPNDVSQYMFATPISGKEQSIPSYAKKYHFKQEYLDTNLLDGILGPRKSPEELKASHAKFLSKLNLDGDTLILFHNSPIKITGGRLSRGEKRGYSNNSDVGLTYYWGSKQSGADPSNGQQYTYFTHINVNDVYDFDTNPHRYRQIPAAFEEKDFIGITWENSPEAVCVVSNISLPIDYVIDRKTNTIYDKDWNKVE